MTSDQEEQGKVLVIGSVMPEVHFIGSIDSVAGADSGDELCVTWALVPGECWALGALQCCCLVCFSVLP